MENGKIILGATLYGSFWGVLDSRAIRGLIMRENVNYVLFVLSIDCIHDMLK